MQYYCAVINAVGNALTAVGTGAHWLYIKAGEAAYYVATLGQGCPQ